MGGAGPPVPLTAAGVDLSNSTQAFNFLQAILDDVNLEPADNDAARHFWYGVVLVIGLATMYNLAWKTVMWSRYEVPPLPFRLLCVSSLRPASRQSLIFKRCSNGF